MIEATVNWTDKERYIGTATSRHAIVMDTATEKTASTPMELVLIALCGCTASDVVGILRKKREQVTEYRVEVHGDRREEHPRSFRRIEVRHILTGRGLTEKSVAHAIQLSDEKYCGVAATLRPTAEIVTSYEIHEQV